MNNSFSILQESTSSPTSTSQDYYADFYFSCKDRSFFNSSFKTLPLLQRETQPNADSAQSEIRFVSHNKACIILQKNESEAPLIRKSNRSVKKQKKNGVTHKKIIQKETRNVSSNTLRIFLKNVVDMKTFDKMIGSFLEGQHNQLQFYLWLASFNINYKNYIKGNQIKKMFNSCHPLKFRKVLVLLMRHYCNYDGILHCLTSKRIERQSARMHLQGLRNVLSHFQSLLLLQSSPAE